MPGEAANLATLIDQFRTYSTTSNATISSCHPKSLLFKWHLIIRAFYQLSVRSIRPARHLKVTLDDSHFVDHSHWDRSVWPTSAVSLQTVITVWRTVITQVVSRMRILVGALPFEDNRVPVSHRKRKCRLQRVLNWNQSCKDIPFDQLIIKFL